MKNELVELAVGAFTIAFLVGTLTFNYLAVDRLNGINTRLQAIQIELEGQRIDRDNAKTSSEAAAHSWCCALVSVPHDGAIRIEPSSGFHPRCQNYAGCIQTWESK